MGINIRPPKDTSDCENMPFEPSSIKSFQICDPETLTKWDKLRFVNLKKIYKKT